MVFGNDRENVFRFFRVHHDVTLVLGKSDYNQAAAQRLHRILKPWGVRCKTVKADDVNRPREISAEEAVAWVGLEPGKAVPGKTIPLTIAGFDVQGPVVLLGTPEDNPLIQFAKKERFLPYAPDANFPGRGRGMLAWQRDAIGAGQESITLVAYDAAGMSEAVGTLYEATAGMDPLTPLQPPQATAITAAAKGPAAKEAPIVWQRAAARPSTGLEGRRRPGPRGNVGRFAAANRCQREDRRPASAGVGGRAQGRAGVEGYAGRRRPGACQEATRRRTGS